MNLPLLRFLDGVDRVVYTDHDGEYVLDDDGRPVYGVWLQPNRYHGLAVQILPPTEES